MIWGLPEPVFLTVHVALSLAGIATGLVVLIAMTRGWHLPLWAAAFLALTLLTSLTGFPLPPFGFDPPRIIGILALLLVGGAAAALYLYDLFGVWRGVYVIFSSGALYLNVFVAVVQSFQKIGPLHALAPTQSEPPFLFAQTVGLALFAYLGFRAFGRFGGLVQLGDQPKGRRHS